MKKDIPHQKVEDIAIAIVPREDPATDELWDTYLINLKESAIENLLISSKGYGEIRGEKTKTSTLRHFFDSVEALHVVQIEPIQPALFAITNEYWISFVHEGHMYDKRYLFVPGSIDLRNFTPIPFINKRGVMIR